MGISKGHRGAELLGDDAAHDGVEIFAGFFMDEGVARFVPPELEAGGERGDPDFADRGVGRNHELGLLGLLENDFELPAFAFDVKAVFIAEDQEAFFEIVKGGVGFALKVFFLKHEFSVHEEREPWVVGNEATRKPGQTPFVGCLVNHNTPHPLFFVSVASKGVSPAVSLLFATLAWRSISVAAKGLTGAPCWRESNVRGWQRFGGERGAA